LKFFPIIDCECDNTINNKAEQNIRSGEKRVGETIVNSGKYCASAKHTTNGKIMQTIIKHLEPFIY
jgi:hypothetical protein